MRITSDTIDSSLHCSYKAYLKINEVKGKKTEYELLQNELKEKYLSSYRQKLNGTAKICYDPKKELVNADFRKGHDYIFNGIIKSEKIYLKIDILEKVLLKGDESKFSYVPILLSANEKISKTEKELICFLAYFLAVEQAIAVKFCKIIYGKNHQSLKINIGRNTEVEQAIEKYSNNEPRLILNKHCPICEFNNYCRTKAKKDDNLSLLDRATTKIIDKYNKKGIFTIQQLSYLYRPRRSRKRKANQPVLHNLEIQALAIRNDKIYVHQMPEIIRKPTEIFLDLEGVPDRNKYYLIGLLICNDQESSYISFWADQDSDEMLIWQDFLLKLNKHPDAPIYHYGSYEPKAIDFLGKRFNTEVTTIISRLVNITNSIYGKIYFPVYSNRLKEIGRYIDASWSSINASGIQSLVWRHRWEETKSKKYKQLLIEYNNEDCRALKSLVDKLSLIKESADSLIGIEFVDQPKKISSKTGIQIHEEFDAILKFGHENYNSNKISFQNIRQKNNLAKRTPGGLIGHKGSSRKTPKEKRVIIVPIKRICPIHKCKLIKSTRIAHQTVTDLVFTKNTIRKTVIKYLGNKSYCPECQKYYFPPQINVIINNHFGHNFRSWVVYQRLALRLPFRVIQMNLQEMFNEQVSEGGLSSFFKTISNFYKYTEKRNLKRIIQSPFIHVDETKINVKGHHHYVWIFTNGKEAFFKHADTREVEPVKELLKDFQGILVSDFYPGFDSLKCKHQKCWVHIIRDINDDLWKHPFDLEYEKFVFELRNIIIPIFESVEKYGLKKRHFNKFKKSIDRYYSKAIIGTVYKSEITIKYQNRLKKYWKSLFTFIGIDNIPWNNNMAERGLRHLAVQRNISKYFGKGIDNYLLFLGIMQTCKFHNKSFLKFLLSGKKDMSKY
jgi:predicted RecB family nuclease